MRFDKFTTKFQQALADAQSLARRQRQPLTSSRSTCCSRCSTRRTAAPRRCSRAPGVNVAAAADARSRRRSTACRRSKGTGGEVNVSRDLDNLLNLTDKEAQKRGDQFIASELFLLALTQDKGETGRLLKQHGADARGARAGDRGGARRRERRQRRKPKAQREALKKYTHRPHRARPRRASSTR